MLVHQRVGHFEWMHLNGGQVVPCRKRMAGCWWPLGPNRAGNHARRHCRGRHGPRTWEKSMVVMGKPLELRIFQRISKMFFSKNCLETVLICQKSFKVDGEETPRIFSPFRCPLGLRSPPVRGEFMGIFLVDDTMTPLLMGPLTIYPYIYPARMISSKTSAFRTFAMSSEQCSFGSFQRKDPVDGWFTVEFATKSGFKHI